MARILIIDDDVRLAGLVSDYLTAAGLTPVHAATGAQGLALHSRQPADLVLLDLMLPDGDGLDVFRALRRLPQPAGNTPVIMLTAKGDPVDRVVGLELGAEDYIGKPFEPRELLARIRVVLRRAQPGTGVTDVLRFGRLEIDRGARVARRDGVDLVLTSLQFGLLTALAERAGRVLSRAQLHDLTHADAAAYDPALDRSIDVHIARIRAVIEDDPKQPRRVLTVRGAGYVFARSQD